MRVVVSGERGRECKNLGKFWILTKEKLERSDHDFELSFNRLHFIARSKVGLLSADVIDNVLFYLSVMYKSCYHSLCVLQAYDTFLRKIIQVDFEVLSETRIAEWYYQSFQDGQINGQVSKELVDRFSEMLWVQNEKTALLKDFFKENNIVLLKLIAYLNHLSIGYQTGGEIKRRAYLFAKLLRLVREALNGELLQRDTQVSDNAVMNVEQINIDSIAPNLKLKIDLFDFGICFKSGKVISKEFTSSQEDYGDKVYYGELLQIGSGIPNTLQVMSDHAKAVGSARLLFEKGIVYLPRDHSAFAVELDSQVYLAKSGGSVMWRLARKLVKKCVG